MATQDNTTKLKLADCVEQTQDQPKTPLDDIIVEEMSPALLRVTLLMRAAWLINKKTYYACIQVFIDSIEGRKDTTPELLQQRDDLQAQLDRRLAKLEAKS